MSLEQKRKLYKLRQLIRDCLIAVDLNLPTREEIIENYAKMPWVDAKRFEEEVKRKREQGYEDCKKLYMEAENDG